MQEQCVKHILIAEDDQNMRQSLVFVLESAGYTVTAVDDGKYAMEQLMGRGPREEPFDLLITDLQMPRLLGVDLISMLEERNINMPVIVISGYSDKKTMIELIRVGCNDFLEKPFTPQKVLERVNEVSHKWQANRKKQQDKEHKLQQQLSDLRRLLASYEERYDKIIRENSACETGAEEDVEVSQKTTAPVLEKVSVAQTQMQKEEPRTQAVAEKAEEEEAFECPASLQDAAVEEKEVSVLLLEQKEEEWLILTPSPGLTDENTPELCRRLAGYLDQGEKKFCFDLSRLSDMGSGVLAVFAALASTLRNSTDEYGLRISGCSDKIASLFRLTALNQSYSMPQ